MYRLNDCKFHNSNFADAKDGERIAIPEGVSRVVGGILAKQLPKASHCLLNYSYASDELNVISCRMGLYI